MPDSAQPLFGPFAFDRTGMVLLRNGQPVEIGQRGVALLKALFAARGNAVTKAELMDWVWPDVEVEEGNLAVQVAALRKSLGTSPGGSEWVVTVPRVGYKLDLPEAAADGSARVVLPSVAVLPFENLSGDPAQDYLAHGIAEDVITALSRFHTFAVIARNSSFAYKNQDADVREVARTLGVRYVLQGSVRRGADRVRVTAQLVEGESGVNLWAERFEGPLEDVFDFQDRITDRVIGYVEPRLRQAEIDRSRRKRPDTLDSYDLYLRSLPVMQGEHDRWESDYSDAISLLHKAIALDPQFAIALAYAAWAHERRWTRGFAAPAGVDDRAEAVALSERAIAADPKDAEALVIAGIVQTTIRHDADIGLGYVRRAVDLHPNSLLVANMAGYAFFFFGKFDESVVQYERGTRLSPIGSDANWSHCGMAQSLLCAGRFKEALPWAQRALEIGPEGTTERCLLVATLAQLGRLDEAKAVARGAHEAGRDMSVATFLGRNTEPDGRDRLLVEGMLLAGLPAA